MKEKNSKVLKTFENISEFESITLSLTSPETIKAWSYGEVLRSETINYRTGRSERGGLFDERIFGPEKDYECYCGKYRKIRYKGIVCEKCGVEVTRSNVRRERMGHIELATPVVHIWFLRGVPSRLSLILDIPANDLEKVIYFASYIITSVNEEEKNKIISELESEYKGKIKNADKETKEKLKELLAIAKKELEEIQPKVVLNEITYRKYAQKYGTCFEAGIGGEVIYEMLKKIDLEELEKNLSEAYKKEKKVNREKISRRLSLVRMMINSKIRPEWMFLTVLPVIPPALRPMVALDGGRHATSDLNDLYRRVINRNNRLKKLKELNAPEVILRNEKRILQEAVDALLDNSLTPQSSRMMSTSQKRELKSLADNLKGKQGLFRQNLLGKRVDYSGRSVIVVGPNLKMNECGLPKHMALELFRPFIIAKILEKEFAFNVRGANRLIDEKTPEVWAILEEVIKDKYVLLNRAPTLHRLSIQAFKPVLIEGSAIQLHPLVCTAFNADFDGDQMAVHVPLFSKAQEEAREKMASVKNLLKPASGDSIVNPKLDMVLGCYWLTKAIDGSKGEGKYFATPNRAIYAYETGAIDLHAKVKVAKTDSLKYKEMEPIFETTPGRLLFNSILPVEFPYFNDVLSSKSINTLVDKLILHYGFEKTAQVLDKIKDIGFRYATYSGITWGMNDLISLKEKKEIIEEARKKEREILKQYEDGLISFQEKYFKVIQIWEKTKKEIEKILPEKLPENSGIKDMLKSGARGSVNNLVQMAGMKGLIVNPAGETLDFPIISSYKEGFSPLEYFISTHGSRKGLVDTALNTAKSGYLTRRLVDVVQDVLITCDDCGTKEGIYVQQENLGGIEIPLSINLRGRVLAENIKDKDGNVIYSKGTLITKEDAKVIENLGIKKVYVYSPLTCKNIYGLCRKCYGMDLGRNTLIDLGEAVGVVAAQSIGEPGTQLTLRTFHAGGVASLDITVGLPRVEELFERRTPKNKGIICKIDGIVASIKEDKNKKIITIISNDNSLPKKEREQVYEIPKDKNIIVQEKENVYKGMLLTEGSADLNELYKVAGKEVAQKYIIDEIRKVYELQGVSISRKHLEVIVRQMFSRHRIIDPGDTIFSYDDIVEYSELIDENERVKKLGKKEAKSEEVILGITETALTTASWLSAASFQNTNRILINSALSGAEDKLRGLKENVIIGKLIPNKEKFLKNQKNK